MKALLKKLRPDLREFVETTSAASGLTIVETIEVAIDSFIAKTEASIKKSKTLRGQRNLGIHTGGRQPSVLDVELIEELRKNGVAWERIGEHFGIKREAAVRGYRRALGLPDLQKPSANVNIEEVRKLRLRGLTWREVSREMGQPLNTLRDSYRAAGYSSLSTELDAVSD